MKILVINSGSSSLKFQVIDSGTEQVLARGVCERIGIDGGFTYKTDRISVKEPVPMADHKAAVHEILNRLEDPELSLSDSMDYYKKGVKLLDKCGQTLDKTEKEIIVLQEGKDGSIPEGED